MLVKNEIEKMRGMLRYLQTDPLLLHYWANNGQAGVSFLVRRKWKDHILRVSNISSGVGELVLLCTTKGYKLKLMQVNAPKPSHQEENTNFYNNVDKTFEKPNLYIR